MPLRTQYCNEHVHSPVSCIQLLSAERRSPMAPQSGQSRKLLAIRNFLKDERLPEKEFLSKIALSEDERVLHIPPHHMVREGGNSCLFSCAA